MDVSVCEMSTWKKPFGVWRPAAFPGVTGGSSNGEFQYRDWREFRGEGHPTRLRHPDWAGVLCKGDDGKKAGPMTWSSNPAALDQTNTHKSTSTSSEQHDIEPDKGESLLTILRASQLPRQWLLTP